ncbi:MAG: hypothetical protein AMJ91_00685 [candidate division Zixibacteria bacterium SM23_73_3]|nr:MAG: hypothetical protein AMJ91_00685 [candidate division Zixibacteria bacterium SM23_73_3]
MKNGQGLREVNKRTLIPHRFQISLKNQLTNKNGSAYFIWGRKVNTSKLKGKMKKIIAFVILYSFLWLLWTFVLLCPGTKAQWEGAKIQRLTFNTSTNRIESLYLGNGDSLFLFYRQWR